MSKLRSDELVNMEGDGAPSFPQGATSIAPTADNQVATKLYVDSALSAASGNAVSPTAPTNPSVGSFWTDTSVNPSSLKTWNGSMWIEFAGTAAAAVGVVVSLPSLSATNLEHAPATITASAAQVSNATLFITKWYKDDVEIDGATGSTYVATEPGVYRYEERWADNAGNVLTPSLNKTIELLSIEAPSITIPVAGSGLTDFDYTAESSAIANVGTVDTLGDDDAFDVKTYTGNSSSQKLTTGLDMSGSGGLFWLKQRNGTGDHWLYDSERGPNNHLRITTDAAGNNGNSYNVDFENDGVTLGSNGSINYSGNTYVGWSFLEEPGFFDVVTYTGSGATMTVPHNLGSTPGMIIIKGTNISGSNWAVYHKELDVNDVAFLNYTSQASEDSSNRFAGVHPTSTEFTVGTSPDTNYTGSEYVAYVFADNPSNEIKCGTFSNNTGNWGTPAAEDATVDCGFEPQFVIAKLATSPNASTGGGWYIMDSTRGWGSGIYNQSMQPNETNAEAADTNFNFTPTSTGFIVTYSSPGDHIYLAIGSPKVTVSNTQLTLTDTTVSKVSDGSLVGGSTIDQVLTVGETVRADTTVSTTIATPVFNATTYTGNGSTKTINTGIDLDNGGGLIWIKKRGSQNHCLQDTEQGLEKFAPSNVGGGFTSSTTRVTGATSSGYTIGNDSEVNASSSDYASWSFRQAPAFFDVVTYTGQYTYPAAYAVPHSLGSVPGMIITKKTSGSSAWQVWHKGLSSTTGKALDIKATAAEDSHSGFFPTAPTADYFYLGDNSNINTQNQSYVAYVFADTPGVIKCGTYTGTGSSQTIDTGFKPKFVLTKSRSHSSDWYLMDSVNPGQALYTNWSGGQQNVPIGYVDNGFTVDGRNFALNEIGYEYIYMAIAEDAEVDITSNIYASGTVSSYSGNTVTLSNTYGTWSTGMKVQGVTTDTKDYPDPIDVSAVTFASSQPVVTSGTVNTWDYAEWNLSYDAQFSSVVHEKAVPLTATGTQAGPDSFPIQAGTEYFVRTKYASFLPSGQSDWSAVTRFLTKANVYVDDVFSIDLYRNDSNTEEFNNGLDMAGEGGLIVTKYTDLSSEWGWTDSERGVTKSLDSSTNGAEATEAWISSFDNDGFTHGSYIGTGDNSGVVSWSFRKAPGFFDVVTYTGNGTAGHTISHSLGSVPGMIIIKNRSNAEQWQVWHRSVTGNLELDNAGAANTSSVRVDSVTSTSFNLTSGWNTSNANGQTYVAYIFGHDDPRFGTNSDEAIIKCGSYIGDGSSTNFVDLGFEPQFVLIKNASSGSTNWSMFDVMRGMPNAAGTNASRIDANSSAAESDNNPVEISPTGFTPTRAGSYTNADGNTFIYMAIRRPHKPATVATDVFDVGLRSGSSSDTNTNSSILTDMTFVLRRDSSSEYNGISSRLMGNLTLMLDDLSSGTTGWLDSSKSWKTMTGAIINGGNGAANTGNLVDYSFKRAPGFFDVVTYTGDGTTSRNISHNLEAFPELVICKRQYPGDNGEWWVDADVAGSGKVLYWNRDNTAFSYTAFGTHTTTTIQLETVANNDTNHNTSPYVAYLFASLDGVSKVGSYTGTGSDLNVDCGFTAGARFVMIKRTDNTGDWYVWDTERGIVSGNDPYLYLNERDAEVNGTDYIDPLNAGFTVTSNAPTTLNASGGTYLFLAIA